MKWEQLVQEAYHYMAPRQEKFIAETGVGAFKGYYYDQKRGVIWFHNDGQIGVEAEMVVVGTDAKRSRTWLWSWANPSVDTRCSQPCLSVKQYGQKHGFKKLVTPKWSCDEHAGRELMTITGMILNAVGAYRCPSENGNLYLVLMRYEKVNKLL
jgi:hypothetical protein